MGNTIKLSLPLWGRYPLSKLSAKRDRKGIYAQNCPLSRLSAPAPPKGEPFHFLNLMTLPFMGLSLFCLQVLLHGELPQIGAVLQLEGVSLEAYDCKAHLLV